MKTILTITGMGILYWILYWLDHRYHLVWNPEQFQGMALTGNPYAIARYSQDYGSLIVYLLVSGFPFLFWELIRPQGK